MTPSQSANQLPPDSTSADRPSSWCVVGGGLLGMTLALRLAQRGQRVTLLEAEDHLGGLADAWEVGGVTWDRHYHVTLLSDQFLRGLLQELGLETHLKWVETRTGFFIDQQLYSLSSSWEFLRFPPLGLFGKLRLGWTIFHASRVRNWRPLEAELVESWLRRHSGHETFERIWLPLLRAKLGDNYRQTSAAFIWATIARLYAARRTGLKKEMFGYVSGGYRTTLARLEQRLRELGVRIVLNARLQRVATESEGISDAPTSSSVAPRPGHLGDANLGEARLRVLASVSGHLSEAIDEVFDRVVLTVPGSIAAGACPQLADDERQLLRRIQYQGIICASLLLRRPLSPYYVTNVADDRVPFTGVIEMTSLVDRNELQGHHLVYLPWYLPQDAPAWQLSDADIESRFWNGLRIIHPNLQPSDRVALRISRVRNVMPIPTLHYSRHVPDTVTSIPGLFVVNSSQIVNGTLNVNETVRLAEESLPRLLQAPRQPCHTSRVQAELVP